MFISCGIKLLNLENGILYFAYMCFMSLYNQSFDLNEFCQDYLICPNNVPFSLCIAIFSITAAILWVYLNLEEHYDYLFQNLNIITFICVNNCLK